MGLLDYNTSDGRFLFFLPWQGHTLVGTTDKKCSAETSPSSPEDEVQVSIMPTEAARSCDFQSNRSTSGSKRSTTLYQRYNALPAAYHDALRTER